MILPSQPNKWSVMDDRGSRQRWLPGAFGDLDDIEHVMSFVVEEDEWSTDENDTVFCTIKRAKVIDTSIVHKQGEKR